MLDEALSECEASSAATCSKKMRLVQKHSLFVHSADQVARDEVKRYFSLGTSAAQEDPLAFWKLNERNFPMLAVLVLDAECFICSRAYDLNNWNHSEWQEVDFGTFV